MERQKVTIVGGGPCGSLLALYLLDAGLDVEVYELRRPDDDDDQNEGDKVRSATKRSINLALSYRGLCALERVNARDAVMKEAVEMHSRFLHLEEGTTTQRYGQKDEAIYSVSRARVVKVMAQIAQERGAKYFYGEKFTGFDDECRPMFASGKKGSTPTFGCDGAFSAVRRAMERKGRYNTKIWYAKEGYKELEMRGGLERNYLHIWPRGETMLIALPNVDDTFTATLFAPFEDLEAMETSWSRHDLDDYFANLFRDAPLVHPAETFLSSKTSPLIQLTVNPWHYQDKILCLGDASHAVVPYYGQGMNAAFEDCLAFSDLLLLEKKQQRGGDKYIDFGPIFTAVSGSRRRAADGLSVLATRNYEDMAKHTASRASRVRKFLERIISRALPLWRPQYSMVTFTRLPYDLILRIDARQEALLSWGLLGCGLGIALLAGTAVLRSRLLSPS